MIRIESRGEYRKTRNLLGHMKEINIAKILNKYGALGVTALSDSTPLNSGETAGSWFYEVDVANGSASLSFSNKNVNNGVNVAIILQYGHGTGTGGYVQGRDYINPAVQPIFDAISESIWEEVRSA